MWKRIFGVALGFLTSGLVIMTIEAINFMIFPHKHDLSELHTQQQIAEAMAELPTVGFFIIMLAHAVGSFSAGLVCGLFVPSDKVRLAVATGFLVLFMGIINLVMIPHPSWFMAVDLIVFIPMAYLGGKLAEARS